MSESRVVAIGCTEMLFVASPPKKQTGKASDYFQHVQPMPEISRSSVRFKGEGDCLKCNTNPILLNKFEAFKNRFGLTPRFSFAFSVFTVLSLPLLSQNLRFYSDTSRNVRKIVLPVLVLTPETHLGVGALGVTLWKNLDPKVPTRTSNAELIFLYTSRKQLILIPRYTIFTRGEKYLIEGFGEELIDFRDFYFGRGNNTTAANRETFTYNVVGLENRIGRRISKTKKVFLGLEVRALRYYNLRLQPGGLLETEKSTGYNGSTSIGFGPALTWDERDNVVNPSRGFYWDFRYSNYSKAFGSTLNYHRTYFDMRKYFTIKPSKGHILAMELFGNFISGDAPIKELAELGGPRIMRGYYRGRFRDNYMTAFQAEYRMLVYKRIGVVAFAGLGKVYNPTSVNLSDLHYSYGGGLRVKINKKEKLNLRLDYARGDPHYLGYFYLGFAESF